MQSSHNRQRSQHPPRVTNVRQFLRPSIQSTTGQLSFAQPPAQFLAVQPVQLVRDGQKGDTAVNQSGMTFGIWFRSEATVSIAARHDEIDGPVNVDGLLVVLEEMWVFGVNVTHRKAEWVTTLTIKASMATAQNENRVSISPHLSPKKLPSGCCSEATYLATASTSTSSKAS